MGEYLPKRKDVHSINMYVRIFYKATRDDFIKVQVLCIDSISLYHSHFTWNSILHWFSFKVSMCSKLLQIVEVCYKKELNEQSLLADLYWSCPGLSLGQVGNSRPWQRPVEKGKVRKVGFPKDETFFKRKHFLPLSSLGFWHCKQWVSSVGSPLFWHEVSQHVLLWPASKRISHT